MTPATPNHGPPPPATRSLRTTALAALGIGGVLVLLVLIAHELMPHHAVARSAKTHDDTPVEVTGAIAPVTGPAPVAQARAERPAAAAKTAATTAPAATAPAAVPLAAALISQVVVNPEAFAPSSTFAPPMAKTDRFLFEQLPPFNSTELKRSRANPKAWELDAMHGPKMDDLGPAGSVREAAVVKDDIGNLTSWYLVESGPLAPAFAVNGIMGTRVMSRAFVEDHRGDFPPAVASLLDK